MQRFTESYYDPDDDYDPDEDEPLDERAARKLITNHRQEYDRLALLERHRDEIAEVQQQADSLRRKVAELAELNPNFANVPALEETVRLMQARTKELEAQARQHRAQTWKGPDS